MDVALLYEGCTAGKLRICREGADTCFEVRAGGLSPGPYRIVAQGIEGELLLGVLDGAEGTLRRRFSSAMTEKVGAIGSARAERCGGARRESPWHTPQKEEFPALPALPSTALCRREGQRRLLALPCSESEPFPLPALFCFARVRSMEGGRWAVFTFDESGAPVAEEN